METPEPLSPIDDVANMFSVDDYMYFYSDYLNAERSNAETYAVVERLEMAGPMRVLDLACGFGRIANRLALLGHQVTGVEYLEGFLQIARRAAEGMGILSEGGAEAASTPRGGSVRYLQGDMRAIDFTAAFERAIMMFNSFGYFTDAENLRVLRNVQRALVPGGLLGFDVGNRDGVLNNFHPHYVSEKEANLMINRFSFDVQTGRLRNDRIIIRDGARKDRPFSIRLYSLTEMRELLAQAGLALEAAYAEWDGSPLSFDSPGMVIVARKV